MRLEAGEGPGGGQGLSRAVGDRVYFAEDRMRESGDRRNMAGGSESAQG